MIAKTKGPEGWKTITNSISTLLEEATFEANSEGISFRGMDPSHVALINIHWPSSAFEKYECNSEVRFAVRVDELVKLLKRVSKEDTIEVNITNDSFILHIYDSYDKTYKLRLIEATSSTTPVPKLSLNTKMRLDMSTFKDILDDIEVVADYITIEASKEKVIFSGKGDLGDVSITLSKSEPIDEKARRLLELESKEDSKATYSLEYLSSITKAIGSSGEDLILEFSSAMPLKIEFRTAQMVKIDFYLAPRVES